jgi:hypothetical protein
VTHFDVFNGDADGLCALHQLRLAEPRESVLVTGVKRDHALLQRVRARAGDSVTVLDVALDRNRDVLLRLLDEGVRVTYFDHHAAADLPGHPLLELEIDTAADVCTSVLVDRRLQGRFRSWAVVAAYGDNLPETAARLAASLPIDYATLGEWRELGECLNYNAYGVTAGDLICPPEQLFRILSGYPDPSHFIDNEPLFERIRSSRAEDMGAALELAPARQGPGATVHVMPDAPWARRVMGSLANHLADADRSRAHAVIVPNPDGSLKLSLRVPTSATVSAAAFCRRFGGGGRQRAGGVDAIAATRLPHFGDEFMQAYSVGA